MLVVTAVMLSGLLAGIVAAQLGGLRLGGVIITPLMAVYLLRSFGSFPVFVVSIIAAYVSLQLVANRVPIYGRRLFLLSIVVGALVPLTMVEVLAAGAGLREAISGVEFIGSILPGIAAYNFHRLDAERRVLDAVWALAVLTFLVVVGIGLVIVVGLTPLAGVLPPVLLGPKSDIAIAFGLTVPREPVPVLASLRTGFALVVFGTVLSEGIRGRYGLRIAGVIVVPVVVIAAFRNQWMLPLWVVTTLLAYAGIQLVHWWTLLYGRVLLSMGVIFGLLGAVSLTVVVPVRHGLLPFFIGILAGVTAYNVHVVPPPERLDAVALTVGVFVVVTTVARLVIVPLPTGFVTYVTTLHLVVGALLLLPAAWVLFRHERIRPNGLDGDPVGDVTGPSSTGGDER